MKNEEKNKENVNFKKVSYLHRELLDKVEINNLLMRKSNLTLDSYLNNYSKMKNIKNNNEMEMTDLNDIIDLQKKENQKLFIENKKLEDDLEIEKKKKVELINTNSILKRIRV